MTRYARNCRDANERALLDVAKKMGAAWREQGPLDGWIYVPRKDKWLPVEIKIPEREGLKGEYTPAQKGFFSWCRLHDAPWLIWRTDDDVIRDLQ